MKRRVLLIISLSQFLIFSTAWAETDNTGAVWTEVGVSKSLPHNLSINFDLGHRTFDWFNESNRWDVGLGLNWKVNKHWKFGLGYVFIMKHYPEETSFKLTEGELEYKYRNSNGENWDALDFLGGPIYTDADGVRHFYRGFNDVTKNDTRIDESFWRQRHRIFFEASYSYKFWKILNVSIRGRYQLTRIPAKTINRTRIRLKDITKYRDPIYNVNQEIISYYDVTHYWQDNNGIIWAEEIIDGEAGPSYNVTNSYLEEHEALNSTETYDHEKQAKTLHLFRSRLKFSIDKKGLKWEPYVSLEAHNNLGDKMHLDKVRMQVGVDYKINKQHEVGLGYILNHENDDDGDQNIHAISVGYNFKF